jgi:hypothetical protein
LKACIAKNVKQYDFPPSDQVVKESYYTHNLTKLLKGAGLEPDLDEERSKNPTFDKYWGSVKDWKESKRYDRPTEKDARDLFAAVADGTNGILSWLRARW